MFSQSVKIKLAFLGIFLISVTGFVFIFPQQVSKIGVSIPEQYTLPFVLGLDLQGGAHLIYQADVSEIPAEQQLDSLNGVRDVIERRVNSIGVSEPLVQTTKSGDQWQVVIELAGITDINEAINLIGETPLLEFREENPNPDITLSPEEQQELAEQNTEAKQRAEEILVQAKTTNTDFAKLAEENTEDESGQASGGALGFLKKGLLAENFEKACFDNLTNGQVGAELVQTDFGYHIVKRLESRGSGADLEVNCSHILIRTIDKSYFAKASDQWLYTGLTGKQLKRAILAFSPNTQQPEINLEFNDEGAALFAALTEKNIGKSLGILLDGEVISAPVVQNIITDGRAVISGRFNLPEAKLLVQRLNSGALPVPIELVSQQTVGASLGAQSLEKSLQAGIIGIITVCLFMILYYRLPGIAAVFALIFYGLLLLTIFKLIPVTLTLAGAAGIILSIGMAVDANILIFERIKDELRSDRPLAVAVDQGFKRAWSSIFDGNMSTLITCFILIGFTTSVVRGFAVTLSIGIFVSMFSAMVITKVILQFFTLFPGLNNNWLFGVKKKSKQ